ncbi:acyltransferase family protein [Psychrobacter sp. Arc29]|uniref:acyltransferase family protein n=1 Tax=Psychrobacter sp. Arc29 TaxID=3046690 RepID=UPI00352CF3D2
MKFRKDINGLRAIAVIAVVLFHFNASWLPGGFAGVDVFFVISGFLMTGIIFRGIEQDNLSISKFYIARANRIIPALALLCFVLLAFGWFYLTPLEYQLLGKHAASSVSFLSNFTYWRETGYFAAASHEKWLLHTWSLSVEWQFYIIYPLVLVAIRKFMSMKTIKLMLIVGTVIGFIFCVIASYEWTSASYYLFPTRAWEMMIGGVAYLYPLKLQEHRKKFLEWAGLSLICASYFFVSADNIWPGYLALFPVVGSFFILQAQRNDSIITHNIVFQKIGYWSYSIYLWHWPLVVAIYTFSLPEYYIYIGMALSILLGFLSYKYVERIKFSNDFYNLISYLRSPPIYIAGVVALLGSALFVNSNAITDYRFSEEQLSIVNQQNQNPAKTDCGKPKDGVSSGCIYGQGPVKAIIIGDSHALAQKSAIGDRVIKAGGSTLNFGMNSCSTIKGVYSIDRNNRNADYSCGKLVANAIKISANRYPNIPIIIINRSSLYIKGSNEKENFESMPPTYFVDKIFTERNNKYEENLVGHMIDTVCDFTQNSPVYLVRPIPEMRKHVPKDMLRYSMINGKRKSIKITLEEYNQRHDIVFRMQDKAVKQCGAQLLNPLPYLCDREYCYGDIGGVPLYYDDDHLSSYGAKLISPIYDEVFE